VRSAPRSSTSTRYEADLGISGHYWIFDGRYVGDEMAYRRLVPGDEYDIPLVRADGALQVVELKLAMGLKSPLVKGIEAHGWLHLRSMTPLAKLSPTLLG
jgi:hypothetical protein